SSDLLVECHMLQSGEDHDHVVLADLGDRRQRVGVDGSKGHIVEISYATPFLVGAQIALVDVHRQDRRALLGQRDSRAAVARADLKDSEPIQKANTVEPRNHSRTVPIEPLDEMVPAAGTSYFCGEIGVDGTDRLRLSTEVVGFQDRKQLVLL